MPTVSSLQGTTREHRAILNNLQADAFRSASQSQTTGQAARAFSGANVTNEQTQTGSLLQMASAINDKTVTIMAVTSTNDNAGAMTYIAGADATDWLSRGAANNAQLQGGEQSAFAKLADFEGSVSTANNSLSQIVALAQIFDVDLTATITNTSDAASLNTESSQSRFRIEANLEDLSAQAIFTTGQRQGTAEAPTTQVAMSDGGTVTNTLIQSASVDQGGSTVTLEGMFDLTATLPPIMTDRLVNISKLAAMNSAINSSAACQQQAITQTAVGGVDEEGTVSQNDGSARNYGSSTATSSEQTSVINSVSVII